MRVHARNIAVAAGAMNKEIERVASEIADKRAINVIQARRVLECVRVEPAMVRDPRHIKATFETLRETYAPKVMELINEVVRQSVPPDSTLASMCLYHLETGGKRLRAFLPLLIADALGVEPSQLLPFGAACEMLHNATLVHDDLQDGDRYRRGQETVWYRFGSPQAVNLGDAMFYYTLLLLSRLDFPLSRREQAASRVLLETLRVIDGQEREFLLKHTAKPTIAEYFAMVEGKTSGLFALPMSGTAILCTSSSQIARGLEEAARHMGVLFQIQDDLLDLYGNEGRESSGNDIREGKRSVLVVHASHVAPEKEVRWLKEILDKPRDETTEQDIKDVKAFLIQSGSLQFAISEINRRKAKALHVPLLCEHKQLLAVIEGMCELFLEPIKAIRLSRLDATAQALA
jgi:geranylgeranyl pyrophosphate synthase